MKGTEAKEIRQNYGFTLEELAEILGYSHKQNIHRIECMENVPNPYRFTLLSLVEKCNSIDIFIKNHFLINEISKQDYQIVYQKSRVIEVRIKENISHYLRLFVPFPTKNIFFDKNISLIRIQFEYKI